MPLQCVLTMYPKLTDILSKLASQANSAQACILIVFCMGGEGFKGRNTQDWDKRDV